MVPAMYNTGTFRDLPPEPAFDSDVEPDVSWRLPADGYWQLMNSLRPALPPPLGDAPEDLVRRDNAVIATIAGLAPANAAEAGVAGQHVVASEHWKNCMRLSLQPGTTPEWAMKLRAQGTVMMREANSALGVLRRMQRERRRVEADDVTCDRVARIEHYATIQMAEALANPPAPRAAKPDPVEPQPEVFAPKQIADAERYATVYPEKAAAIRRTGKVPDDAERPPNEIYFFCPHVSTFAEALIAGRTPALLALDNYVPGTAGPAPRHSGRV